MFILFISYENSQTEDTRIYETVVSIYEGELAEYVNRANEEFYGVLFDIKEVKNTEFEVIQRYEM
ncbi:MAG: hypothetical protein ACRC6E_05735 [Fusobacteriaceae bacterium]